MELIEESEQIIKRILQILEEENDWTPLSDSDGIQSSIKQFEDCPVAAVRATGIIDLEPQELGNKIWNLDLSGWQEFEPSLIKRETVEELDENHKLIHQIAQFPWPLWNRDFCLLGSRRSTENGGMNIWFFSVSTPKVPEDPQQFVRALIKFSGYILKPEENKTRMLRIICVDPGGIIPAPLVNAKAASVASFYSWVNLNWVKKEHI